jgi:plastocyanin
MKKKLKKNTLFIGVVILLLLGFGTYLFTQKPTMPPEGKNLNNSPMQNFVANNSVSSYNVAIAEYKFTPTVTVVQRGDTVIWTNNDPVAHTVTSDSGTELNSPLIASGTSYSHLFNISGTFDYHCSIHSMMKGEVIVQ